MRIAQGEQRFVVIEAPLGSLPITGDVTLVAGLAQCAIMLVILQVAGHAITGRILEDQALVATLAFDLDVLTQQGELGLVMVELALILPATFVMARRAIATQATLVLVVLLVTTQAIRCQLLLVQGACVTGLALGMTVLAVERVLGVHIVIEHAGLPAARVVTGLALLTKLALMASPPLDQIRVILVVTSKAIARRVLVALILMASTALDLSVFVGQVEPRLGMIERRLLPARLIVAIGALAAQSPLVHIAFFVAGRTISGCFTPFSPCHMAGLAFDGCMLPRQ